ncbi:tRNA N(3)-methylcytidine methyltransferase trm141-like [Andrographis paniculata]|uniref:tRNA N(3)-methylcytidine methyltransferase trm141-like n=1 Tax=Andrographis paniculata TaxID=175694 RepID=UPI0021E94D74|nr:tRNA N(3)-methylcytidine methyltransferase trm141-like [Andrographis paniculata]XP_051147638.1 tRNA N(3)-methylcytidine methyltransferase trm141-like [Andrographis paniculata]XP_051147639.1 tRNA N(3)-methylcytidine methyltransferase trm141-like [Andrographis paniculata]
MTAAIARPTVLFSPLSIYRRISSSFPVVRFELSCSKSTFRDFDEHYLSRKSIKCWDNFYKHHRNKFFKDRHYLERDWGDYFSDHDDGTRREDGIVLLELGCGAGNTIFPLIAAFPKLCVHACDFSAKAVSLVKKNSNFDANRINLFVCDVVSEALCDKIPPSSVDVVTLIFMLSAVSPSKMTIVLNNLNKVLKPNGHVLVRDYAFGDSSQVKLANRNQMISDNFYYRGDGTFSYYFSEEFLSTLFQKAGFDAVYINTYCREVENRFRNMTFQRRWIRAVFRKNGSSICQDNL